MNALWTLGLKEVKTKGREDSELEKRHPLESLPCTSYHASLLSLHLRAFIDGKINWYPFHSFIFIFINLTSLA